MKKNRSIKNQSTAGSVVLTACEMMQLVFELIAYLEPAINVKLLKVFFIDKHVLLHPAV